MRSQRRVDPGEDEEGMRGEEKGYHRCEGGDHDSEFLNINFRATAEFMKAFCCERGERGFQTFTFTRLCHGVALAGHARPDPAMESTRGVVEGELEAADDVDRQLFQVGEVEVLYHATRR